jgi:hypothetical protein
LWLESTTKPTNGVAGGLYVDSNSFMYFRPKRDLAGCCSDVVRDVLDYPQICVQVNRDYRKVVLVKPVIGVVRVNKISVIEQSNIVAGVDTSVAGTSYDRQSIPVAKVKTVSNPGMGVVAICLNAFQHLGQGFGGEFEVFTFVHDLPPLSASAVIVYLHHIQTLGVESGRKVRYCCVALFEILAQLLNSGCIVCVPVDTRFAHRLSAWLPCPRTSSCSLVENAVLVEMDVA